MMQKVFFLLLLFVLSASAETINIAVSANVSYAIQELKQKFEKDNPDIDVRIILGSSGKLTAQIINGAPYGLFMSANMKYPHTLHKRGFSREKPIVYARGTLVLLSTKKQDFSQGLQLLKHFSIKKIAVANPRTAPYGEATLKALKAAHIYEEIKQKFIYAESISQTLTYISTAADVGVVAKSLLFNPKAGKFQKNINWIDVNVNLYTPIEQGMVLIEQQSQNTKAYKLFYEFVLSDMAKKIFKKYGYIL